jgi:hypothetical protein
MVRILFAHGSLTTALADDERDTRLSLSAAGRKAARHVRGLSGGDIFDAARKFKDLTGGVSQIHNWGDRGQDQGGDTLVLSIGGNVNLGEQK